MLQSLLTFVGLDFDEIGVTFEYPHFNIVYLLVILDFLSKNLKSSLRCVWGSDIKGSLFFLSSCRRSPHLSAFSTLESAGFLVTSKPSRHLRL